MFWQNLIKLKIKPNKQKILLKSSASRLKKNQTSRPDFRNNYFRDTLFFCRRGDRTTSPR